MKLLCRALNYGAIGSILGHELSHGFDNSGRLYDSDGNLQQLWTNESVTEYTKKAQCFIDHYNTYYEAEVSDQVWYFCGCNSQRENYIILKSWEEGRSEHIHVCELIISFRLDRQLRRRRRDLGWEHCRQCWPSRGRDRLREMENSTRSGASASGIHAILARTVTLSRFCTRKSRCFMTR